MNPVPDTRYIARGLTVGLRPAGPSDAASFESWVSLSTAGALAGGGSADGLGPAGWRSVLANGPTRYAIVETGSGDATGAVSWRRLQHGAAFDVGGLIGDSATWSLGFGLEGAMLIVDHLIRNCGARRIELVTALYNSNTVPLLVKGGVVVEAILRDNLFLDGRRHDTVVCSILASEYDEPVDGHVPRGRSVGDGAARAARLLAGMPRRGFTPSGTGAP